MLQKEHRKILPIIHPPNTPATISFQTTLAILYKVTRPVKTVLSKAYACY